MPIFRNSGISMFAYLSNSVIQTVHQPRRSCLTETPTLRASSQQVMHCSSEHTLEREVATPPSPRRAVHLRCDPELTTAHSWPSSDLHSFVVQHIRTAFCIRHVRRQLLIDGSRVRFHHEAPIGPCFLSSVPFVWPPENTSINHLSCCVILV